MSEVDRGELRDVALLSASASLPGSHTYTPLVDGAPEQICAPRRAP